MSTLCTSQEAGYQEDRVVFNVNLRVPKIVAVGRTAGPQAHDTSAESFPENDNENTDNEITSAPYDPNEITSAPYDPNEITSGPMIQMKIVLRKALVTRPTGGLWGLWDFPLKFQRERCWSGVTILNWW